MLLLFLELKKVAKSKIYVGLNHNCQLYKKNKGYLRQTTLE